MKKPLNTVTAEVSPWRFKLVLALLAVLVLLLVKELLVLQVLDTERGHAFLQGQGDARTVRTEVIPAYRGVILDRNGEPLAVSTPVASIWINPKQLIAQEARWQELAIATALPYATLEQKILGNVHRGFVYLRRHLSPDAAKKITSLGIEGVNVQREYKRYYPAGEVSAHLIGFTNIDDRGQEGIELAYDRWLQGQAGKKRVLKDLKGNTFRDVDQRSEARAGKDLSLSIDLRLQYLAHRELQSAMQRVNAKSGSVVMLDAHSGEVLAMANQPVFNPNNRRQLQPASLRNRAMTDMFEPGSTMKPLTVVAALESGKYQPDTLIDTHPGHIKVGRKAILDPVNYRVIDMTKMITKSSQVATSKVALSLDEQKVWEVFSRFGLGVSTGSGFPGESAGLLPNRPNWLPIERVNFAFGHGLTVTSLQLAQAYSVFANNGLLRPAVLLRNDDNAEQLLPATRVISEKINRQVVAMMKTVTLPGGTATAARTASYTVAGKTGTSHKVGGSGYLDDRYTAVFAGLAPASDPRLVVVVMIDEPDLDNYHGGEAAAPVFGRVIGEALRILDVVPDKINPQQVMSSANKSRPKVWNGGRKSA